MYVVTGLQRKGHVHGVFTSLTVF